MQTLVLNSDYSLFAISSWEKAVVLLLENKAQLVLPEAKDGKVKYVHSPSIKIQHPAIIRMFNYLKVTSKRVRLCKQNVFLRDNFTCQYSGNVLRKTDLDIDHVIPRSLGGKNTWENIVTCSRVINAKKGCKKPQDAGLSLLKKPQEPKWQAILRAKILNSGREDWVAELKNLGII